MKSRCLPIEWSQQGGPLFFRQKNSRYNYRLCKMIWTKTSTNINDLFWVLQICLLSSNRQLILRFPKNSILYYPLKTARPPKHHLFWNSVSKEIPTNVQPISEHQSKNHHICSSYMFIIYVINMFTDSSVTSYFTYIILYIYHHIAQQNNSSIPSGKLTWLAGKWTCWVDVFPIEKWFPIESMLVYWRVSAFFTFFFVHQGLTVRFTKPPPKLQNLAPLATNRFQSLRFLRQEASVPNTIDHVNVYTTYMSLVEHWPTLLENATQSAGLAGVSSEMGLDDGLLVCTLLLLI